MSEKEELELSKEYLRPAYKIDFLVRAMMVQGVEPNLILANTSLQLEQLGSADTRISMADLVQVYTNVQQHSNDPAIAIKVGKQIDSTCYGIYGHALLSFPDVRQALIFAINFHSMVTRTVRMDLVEPAGSGISCLRFSDLLHDPSLFQFNIDFQLGIVLALFRDMLGNSGISFKEARVTYLAPENAENYRDLLNCPVYFSQVHNEFVFDTEWLDLPLPRSNPFGLETLLRACEDQLKEWCKGDGLLIAVRKIVAENLDADLNAEMVASYLNMTSRTLRRRLATRDTSFREIHSNLRIEKAQQYLSDSDMSIDAIAARVGYRDTANFRNAFKRWARMTPGDYRKNISAS